MREGLYRVHFQTPLGWGAGVVYASGGRLWGGDASMYYLGTYQVTGENFQAEVRTNRHTQVPGITSVFGRDQVKISLKGAWSQDAVRCSGSAAEAPGVAFTAELTWMSE